MAQKPLLSLALPRGSGCPAGSTWHSATESYLPHPHETGANHVDEGPWHICYYYDY